MLPVLDSSFIYKKEKQLFLRIWIATKLFKRKIFLYEKENDVKYFFGSIYSH